MTPRFFCGYFLSYSRFAKGATVNFKEKTREKEEKTFDFALKNSLNLLMKDLTFEKIYNRIAICYSRAKFFPILTTPRKKRMAMPQH